MQSILISALCKRLSTRVFSAKDLLSSVHLLPKRTRPSVEEKQRVSGVTRMVTRYMEFQQQYPGFVVLMQVGDFYELYGPDAERVAKILDIGLTVATRASSVAMTGVPVRSAETYIERLVKAGHSVVVCDQYGTGNTRGRPMYERMVTRIMTPGTIIEEGLLESGCNNFLAAVVGNGGLAAVAWMDFSTGFFRVNTVSSAQINDELIRINAKELLIQNRERFSWLAKTGGVVRDLPVFETASAFKNFFPSNHGSSLLTDLEKNACAAVLAHISQVQLDSKPFIEYPVRFDSNEHMHIDASSLRALEIIKNNQNSKENSLLSAVDMTVTAAGARLLSQRLQAPSMDIADIALRHNTVEFLLENRQVLDTLRRLLKSSKDMERSFQRLCLNRNAGSPRDMQLVKETLYSCDQIKRYISQNVESKLISSMGFEMSGFEELGDILQRALNEKLPYRLSDGGVIRQGFSESLDALRSNCSDFSHRKSTLEAVYKAKAKRNSLKVEEGRFLGLYIEVSKAEGFIEDPFFVLESQNEGKLRYRTEVIRLFQSIRN